jgi:hypothetical protein
VYLNSTMEEEKNLEMEKLKRRQEINDIRDQG